MAEGPSSAGLRILILEDVATDAELMELEVRRAKIDFTAKRVVTRPAFLRALREFAPDIVLADYRVPGFGGMEALQIVQDRAPSIPLIIVTGAVGEQTGVDCIQAGAADYILKDRLARLAPAVLGALEKKREREKCERAEEALRASERYFRSLIENAQDLITVVEEDGTIRYQSPSIERVLGYLPTELVGSNVLELIHPEDRHDVTRKLAQGFAEPGTAHSVVCRIRHKDGTYRTVESIGSAHLLDRGRLQGVVNSRDVTERERTEQRQTLLTTAIEQAAESIVITHTDGTIEYVNPAVERTTGYSREELIGQNPSILKSGKHDPALYRQLWTTILAGQVWNGHLVNRRKDGTLFEEEVSIAPVRDENGNIMHFVGVKRDVTDEIQLRNQLRQAQKMEAVGQLTGGIAHDFNNILTAVLGNAELVASGLPEGAELRADVDEIQAAARRGAALIKKLMAFSRQEQLHVESVNIGRICEETTAMLCRILPENIDIQVATADADSHVRADRGAVEQIFVNLATNARDAMPEGGVLRIAIRRVSVDGRTSVLPDVGRPGEYVCLSVSDTGVGMDEQTKTKIFEPFFTTKPVGEGTGLGMAVIYGLVKQQGGFIRVYSEVGKGTTIKICFPVTQEPVTREKEGAAPAPGETELRGGSETILLAEDEEQIRRSARRVLERHGYRVLTAADGEQALEVLRAREPKIDLVITDVVMPKLGGQELYRRTTDGGRRPAFLFTSGYVTREVRENGGLDPSMPFLEKPWTVAELLIRVREVLDGSTELAEEREP